MIQPTPKTPIADDGRNAFIQIGPLWIRPQAIQSFTADEDPPMVTAVNGTDIPSGGRTLSAEELLRRIKNGGKQA